MHLAERLHVCDRRLRLVETRADNQNASEPAVEARSRCNTERGVGDIRDALDAILEPTEVLGTPVDILLVLVQLAPGCLFAHKTGSQTSYPRQLDDMMILPGAAKRSSKRRCLSRRSARLQMSLPIMAAWETRAARARRSHAPARRNRQ